MQKTGHLLLLFLQTKRENYRPQTQVQGTFADYADLVDGDNNIDISGAKAYLKVITSTSAVVALGGLLHRPSSIRCEHGTALYIVASKNNAWHK